MDDLTNLISQLGGADRRRGRADPAAALSGLQHAVQQEGGLDGLMGKLKDAGPRRPGRFVGRRPGRTSRSTRPAGPALGPETVQRLSAGSGIDIASLLPMLAAFLPQIIDMLTPNGQEPAGGLTGQGMPDLGGLLGGLAGGAPGRRRRGQAGPRRPARWSRWHARGQQGRLTPGRASTPGIDTRPSGDAPQVGGRRARNGPSSGAWTTPPASPPHASAGSSSRSRSSGCPPCARRDAAHRPDLVLVGR